MSDDHPSSLSGIFGRPFTEQVAFFRRKLRNLVPTRRWDDMVGAAHDDGFMVAGAAKADLLTDLAAATDKAITEGRGIEAFRKDFRAIVKRNGWTGWAGEGSVRGEAWRVGVIYRTNSYTSYAAGRHAQLVEENWKYWVYRHGGSEEPRPHHLAWDGIALPPDHPFWKTHYPPSDWGCSCYVVGARSERGIRRLGGDPDKKLPADWDKRDPKTGAPIGVGRGWDYAPGASVSPQVQALAGKVRHWDYQVAKAFMDELPADRRDALAEAYRALPTTADDARRYAQRIYEPLPDLPGPPPVRTLGAVRSDQAATVGRLTMSDVTGFDFTMDASSLKHILREHGRAVSEATRGQRAIGSADYANLPALISRADRIEDAGVSWSTGQALVRFVWRQGDEEWHAVFEVRRGRRTLALTSLLVREVRRP